MSNGYVCSDCRCITTEPQCNGDGKHRCPRCSIKKYEKECISLSENAIQETIERGMVILDKIVT